MAQLSDTGYKTKTQNEYFAEEQAFYEAIDPDWPLDPSSPDGLKCAHDAEVFTALDQKIKQAYDARDPNKATGKDLDVLRALTGARRSLGTPTTVTLTLSGVPGTVIPRGSKAKNTRGNEFATDEAVTLHDDGIATVKAHCTQNGAVEIGLDEITQIVDVIGGWQKVTNPAAGETGTDRDSDSVFRLKSARAVARQGTGQKDSLYGSIYDVDGVRKVRIYENKTGSDGYNEVSNPYSLPAHSIAIMVDGGEDEAVARAIYDKLAPGCYLHGAGNVVNKRVYSLLYPASYDDVTFSRPVDVQLKITVKVADPQGTCPAVEDLQHEIRQAFIDFYEGDLIPDGIGFLTTGFDIGDTVPYSRLFTPPNKVLGKYAGSYVTELKVNGGTADVACAFNQLPRFLRANITVEIP